MNADESKFEWLSGGGELSELIRANDWSATPLGPLESWPQSLRTTVSLCLASSFPIDIIWGPEAIQIYNAGYRVICGAAHPRAIGESYRVTWASAWPALGEPFEKARRGETSYLENQRMFLERNGYLEETFFTFSLSPIRDEHGGVAGLFHPVTETTAAMLSERRTRALRDIANKAGSAESIQEASRLILNALAEYRHDVPFVMLYQYESANDRLRLLGATGVEPGAPADADAAALDSAPWPFQKVLETGQGILVLDVVARVGAIPCADYPEEITRAFVVAIKTNALAPPFGFVVVGLSTRLPFDESYEGFIATLGAVVGTAIGTTLAYEHERRRADELAALDAAKTAFFSNVSHEFRTPLTLMLGPLADLLANTEEPLRPGQRERLELVNRNALRLLKLVNTLLDFSRIQAGRVEAVYRPTDLPRMTADLASVFRAAIEKAGLTFKVEMRGLGEPVFVDHDMWEKIVLNLLSNAFKFTFQGEIAVRLERRDEHACLTVRDSGSGIPAEELPNLFQRFHRVQGSHGRTYEGSGIGLALINELVKLHGGTIGATSQEGAGSCFEISIPFGSSHLPAECLSQDAAPSAVSPMRSAFIEEASGWVPEPRRARAANASRRRIVIADDNADMRAYLTGLLHPLGAVEAVEDGEAALASIRGSRPDLIVCDVMMPKLDGFGLLKRLRADPGTANLPFVLLSAKAGEESRIEGLRLGADDFLVKPFSARELVARATTQLKLGEARHIAEIERNHLYEFFMQAPIPMVIMLGREYRFFLANEPYEKLVGKKVVGKTVRELFPAQDIDLFIPLLDQVYVTGRPFIGKDLEFRLPDENGALHDGFVDVSYHPFRESSDEIRGILAIAMDVTEQARARKAIEKEQLLLQTQVRSTGEALDRTKEELRALAGSLLGAQEDERRRIARELHDDLSQRIAVVAMRLAALRSALPDLAEDLHDDAQGLESYVALLASEVRRLSHGLHPSILDDLGLAVALRRLVEDFQVSGAQRVTFTERDLPNDIARDTAAALYRITQEALRNIGKHAGAGPARIGLEARSGELRLTIADTGPGFDPAAVRGLGGLGIISMQERARLVGGSLSLDSHPGAGTTIEVRVPRSPNHPGPRDGPPNGSMDGPMNDGDIWDVHAL